MTHQNTATAGDDRSSAQSVSGVTVSRRSLVNMLVKSSAVVATAGALPATVAPALAAPEPDDPVIALALEVERLNILRRAANVAYQPFDHAHIDWLQKNPQPKKSTVHIARQHWNTATGDILLNDTIAQPVSPEQLAAEKRAWRNWSRRHRRFCEKSGYYEAERRDQEACDALGAAIDQLAETVPTTFAGLVAKAHAARAIGDIAEEELFTQIVKDIGLLAGEIAREEANGEEA